MNICPDYNSTYYKELEKIHGVDKAPMIWFNEEIMKLSGETLLSPDKIVNNNKKNKKAVNKKKNDIINKRLAIVKQGANKPVFITINDEQQRLYRVQKTDFDNNLIPNDFIDIKTQNDAIDSIFSLSYLALLQTPLDKRDDLTEEKLIDTVLDNIVYIYNNLIDIENLPKEEQEKNKYYSYLPYINTYEEIVTSRSQVKKFALERFAKVKLDIKRLAEEITQTMDEQNDRTTYKNSEERNPKETMSDRVKLFISTAIEYKYENGKSVPVKNSIGFDQIVNDSIYEKLLQIFSNKPDLTLDELTSTLKKDELRQPTLYQLGIRLESSAIEDRVKNEIVSAFKKVNLKSYVTQYTKEGDSYTFMTFEGNRNSYLRKIIEIWKQEQKLNFDNRLLSYDSDNNIIIDEQKVTDLYNKVIELNNNEDAINEDYNEVFNNLIDGLGITLSDLAKLDIKNSVTLSGSVFSRYNNKTLKEQFEFAPDGSPTGLFSDILHTLNGKSQYNLSSDDNVDSKLIVRNPLYVDDKAIRFLGEIQGKYADIITSTHTTVEGKKTYDYLLPAYQYTQFLKAKFSEEYRDELSKDIFASNSFIFRKILLNDKIREDYEIGLFEAIKNEKSKKGVTRSSMSDRENILADFNNFVNDSNALYANYFDLTKSDKSTSPFHYKVPKINTKAEIMQEYFYIFNAEYTRIQNKDNIKTLSGQLKKGSGLFYLLPMFNYEMMLKLKEKNVITEKELKIIWEDSETLNKDITLDNEEFMAVFTSIIDSMINEKVDNFSDIIINESIPIPIGDEMSDITIKAYLTNKHIFNISLAMFYSGDPASFYKGNSESIVDNINTTYDQYTKRLAKDIAPGIAGNYQKSSYTAITLEVPKTFSDAYLELDLNSNYGLIHDTNKGQIDSSDASQFSSVKRYFQILYDYGRVPERIYSEIQDRNNPNELLTEEQMSYIAPMKPVEVNRNTVSISSELTYSHINYVKSFLLPLVPNIVNGTHMEQLMLLMDKNDIDQASLDSAGKSGNPVMTFKPFDINNNWIFNDENISELTDSKRIMNSDAFLIQQELPYDETKEKITFITQLNKLVIDTISFIPESVFSFQDEMLNGEQIANKKEEIRKKILDLSFSDLKDEFGIKQDGTIDKSKIVEYIIRTSDDLTINQKEELKLDSENNFVIPLMFNRSSNQIQSKIASAVRKAIQVKISGKSFVQASSLGIGKIDLTGNIPNQVLRTKGWKGDKLRPLRAVISEIHEASNSNIEIYLTQKQLNSAKKQKTFKLTDKQKKILESNPELIENNVNIGLSKDYSIKMLPAEVLVPFNFFDNNENRIDINNFIDENGNVDIDEELLKLVGARIPNQSHSSQLPIKIVGFLPSIGGDIMYVPAEITKQMGSDFDVDKLYVYKKKYKPFKASKEIDNLVLIRQQKLKLIKKSKKENKPEKDINFLQSEIDTIKEEINNLEYNKLSSKLNINSLGVEDVNYVKNIEDYKNDYFDILYSVLTSSNVFEKIMQPLDMDDLKEVVKMRNTSNNNKDIVDLFDPINQLKSYTSNVGVKALVGTFSLHLTFNALLQRTKGISLINHNVIIGGVKLTTFSGLGRSNFKAIIKGEQVNEKRTTSDNIIIPQTEAVDHANNQIADKVNLNSNTVNAYSVILQLKNDKGQAVGNEYASQLINNNVIKQYVNNLRTFQDGFNDAKGSDGKKEAYEKTLIDLGFNEEIVKQNYKSIIEGYNNIELTDEVLGINRDDEGYIISMIEPNSINYRKILNSFIELSNIGDEFFKFLIATNFDTKGFGTNLLEGLHKKQLVQSLKEETKYISNFESLLREPVDTSKRSELGHTIDLSVNILDSLSTLFDYNILDNVIEKIRVAKNSKELRPTELRTIITNFQSYVYSFPVMWSNIEKERYRLIYGKKNVASQLVLMKQKYPEYLLFKKLELKLADNKEEPNYIAYRTLDIEQDSQYIYNEFFALTASSKEEISNFMIDLVKYAYITGGVSNFNSFVNLIPPSIIEQLLANNLKEVLVSNNYSEESFVRQYFQHNPEEATSHSFFMKSINKYKKKVNDLTNFPVLDLPFDNLKKDEIPPRFVYMKGGNYEGKKKTFLYEKVLGTFNKYVQIDTLGDYNSNEYNYMKEFAESMIPINRSLINTNDMIKELSNSLYPKEVNNDSVINMINSVNGNLTSTLFKIMKEESEFKQLANILFLHHKIGKGKDINIELSDEYSSYNGNNLTVSTKSENMLKDLMHETLHHETYNYLNDNDSIITYKLNMIRKQAVDNLSDNNKKIINELEKVNAYDKVDMLEKIRIDNNLTYEHISKLYFLSNVHEFVTGAFTDKDFQVFLNNIVDNSDKQNLFVKFKLWLDRLVTEIANNIGIQVDKKNLLYATIEQVFIGFDSDISTTSNAEMLFSQADIEEAKEIVKKCK